MVHGSNIFSEPPLQIVCEERGITFTRGIYIGSGRTSSCYEFADLNMKEIYAGKVISKMSVNNSKLRKKINNEIDILNSVGHENIVNLLCHFDDFENHYLIFEYCLNLTLHQYLRIRKSVTEPEARYFVKQLCNGCAYLHSKNIVHRNIKLESLYLTGDMVLKIGKFNLSKCISSNGNERNKTVCGDFNSMESEVIGNDYSFKVDIWAIGCVLYKLIYGKTPLKKGGKKNSSVKMSTYHLILPSNGSEDVKMLITSLLHPSSNRRPDASEILKFPFFTGSSTSSKLPGFDLCEQTNVLPQTSNDEIQKVSDNDVIKVSHLPEMWIKIEKILRNNRIIEKSEMDVGKDLSIKLPYFITTWVDHSNNTGLFYQLSDNSTGVLFNDRTNLIIDSVGEMVRYNDIDGTEKIFSTIGDPSNLQDKIYILLQASKYMNENLAKTNSNTNVDSQFNRPPVLKSWFRTNEVIVFYLSNEVLQVNFFHSHKKIILSPEKESITVLDKGTNIESFKLQKLLDIGCDERLLSMLEVIKNIVDKLSTDKFESPNTNDFKILSGTTDRLFLNTDSKNL